MADVRETDLYAPLKSHLERLGYVVKGEVGAADVVAIRDGDDPLLVELKLSFSLALLHQAVERLGVSEKVYVCVAEPARGGRDKAFRRNLKLCRRIGIGVITVRRGDGHLVVHCDPGPYAARTSKKKKARLLNEFERRQGDPNDGGATRHGIVTSYRQDALRCAAYLAEYGVSKGAAVARDTGVKRATAIMGANHYGWFERVRTGHYGLTQAGTKGLSDWADSLG